MANLFDLFDKPKQMEETLLNSEMDDIELPSDVELPTTDQMLSLTTNLDQKVTDLEETPVAIRANSPHPVDERSIGEEMLSVTSEVNVHSDQIEQLSTTVRELTNKSQQMVNLDSTVRKMQTEITELRTDVSGMKDLLSQIRQSMTSYQTATVQRMADLERRALTAQLKADVKPDTEALVPPAEVVVSKGKDKLEIPTAPTAPMVVSLDDF